MIQFQVVSSNKKETLINLFQDVGIARNFAQQQSDSGKFNTVSVTVVVDCWQDGKKIHPSQEN